MRVKIDGWVTVPKAELPEFKQRVIRDSLTIIPKKTSEFQAAEDLLPLRLYDEDATSLRVPREWFFESAKARHDFELDLADGEEIPEERARLTETIRLPEGKVVPFQLRPEQAEARDAALHAYRNTFLMFSPTTAAALPGRVVHPPRLGFTLQAPTGWGKTVWAATVISAVRRKTLVLVHKDFLLTQWRDRLQTIMPGIRVGLILEKTAELDADVCIGMLQTMGIWAQEMRAAGPDVYADVGWEAKVRFPPTMMRRFGVVIADEGHRMGARTWVPVPPLSPARFRILITATPRRKDGCENAFFWHFGRISFVAKEKRLVPKVRRVHTGFHLVRTAKFNPDELGRPTILKIMLANEGRNRLIAQQLAAAVKAGRKIIVLSDKLKQLSRIHEQFQALREKEKVDPNAVVDYYVGGRKRKDLDKAGRADIVLATFAMASEGLDLPWLDTLFLASPKSDVEQAVGRILRPFEGKKEPVVVDFIDDLIEDFAKSWGYREEFYEKLIGPRPPPGQKTLALAGA